jgi:NAD(P)-dependent dehydrogenase (short-subunit alcohol dehydrogenase family)
MAIDPNWDAARLPSQSGKTFVITGGNAGLGYFTAEQLAAAGGRIVMASRSREKANVAAASIRSRVPSADVSYIELNLSSLASIREAAEQIRALDRVDVLINNAGVTSGPNERRTTDDGLELVVGSNAFGPFALTALVFPSLQPGARVVNLGSMATRIVAADIRNLQSETGKFNFFRAYGYSKHGMHAFTFELQRRLTAAGSEVQALLAHPGFAVDGLSSRRAGITDTQSARKQFTDKLMGLNAHGKDHGSRPIVRASIDPDAQGGQFYGPRWSLFGPAVVIEPVSSSASPEFGAEFWKQAEVATGISFDV